VFYKGYIIMEIGKYRGLSLCETPNHIFSILALDHRGNLKRAMNPSDPDSVPYWKLVEFKNQVVSALSPYSSAVLLDPEIGAAPAIASQVLPGNVGLLVSIEETGYSGTPSSRLSQILPDWSVGKIRRMGASGVKLLVYYHPDSPLAKQQEALVGQVAEECVKFDLPLFIEPLSYSLDQDVKNLPSEERRQIIIMTARKLTSLGVDILKAEFPVDVLQEQDRNVWLEACQQLTEASLIPWTLLSAGVEFDTFLEQVKIACQAGASGVLAGRAVWKEAVDLIGEARLGFLRTTAADRMAKLTAICDDLGHPWTASIQQPDTGEKWYSKYFDL
jgi:tagatose 1,6-diphosphate aldolase